MLSEQLASCCFKLLNLCLEFFDLAFQVLRQTFQAIKVFDVGAQKFFAYTDFVAGQRLFACDALFRFIWHISLQLNRQRHFFRQIPWGR